MSATFSKPAATQLPMVGMGQIQISTGPNSIRSVLGSCIGIAIYHPRSTTSVFAHIVLADSAGRPGLPGKFVDTAIPEMMKILTAEGVPRFGRCAKMTGGSQMFGATGPMRVGEINAKAVRETLKLAEIPLIAEDVGGERGRRVEFDCELKTLTVEIAGNDPLVL